MSHCIVVWKCWPLHIITFVPLDPVCSARLQSFFYWWLHTTINLRLFLWILIKIWFQLFGNVYLKTVCAAYVAFLWYDWRSGDCGGRGTGFVATERILKFHIKTIRFAFTFNSQFEIKNCQKHQIINWNKNCIFSRVHWIRSLNVWKHCMNYFPIDLVKTADLPPDRNYLICVFPHGVPR